MILVSVVKRATPDCRASEAKGVKLVSRENKVQRAKKVIPEIEGCRAFPEKKVKREMLA